MDLDLDLDTSWIEKEEKRFSLEMNHDKSSMDSISCVFIYIDGNLSIQKIIKEREPLVSIHSDFGILNSRILQIIQERRHLGNGMKYKIMNLLKFVVDLETERIQEFINDDESTHFLKEVSMFHDIIIEPSIFVFHPLHSLYFFFKEDNMVIKPMKSILKSGHSRITKKVRIFIDSSNVSNELSTAAAGKKRTTRKIVEKS